MEHDPELMNLGARPSTGMVHWGVAVRTQLARVRAVRDSERQRLRSDPIAPGDRDGGLALHFDTHFLVIAIRNVLRFHEAIASRLADDRLRVARDEFDHRAPEIGHLRDYYEHLDAYTVGTGRHQKRVTDYAAPVLDMRGDEDTLDVLFGGLGFEVIEAGEAAFALAQETGRIWFEAVNPYGASVSPLTI